MMLLTQWAVTSSALILIVLAVRFLFRDKLSARLRYALWGVVLLRLLLPFQVTLPATVSDSLPLVASNLAAELPSVLERPLSPDTAASYTRIPAEYLGPNQNKKSNGEPAFSFTAADLQVYDPIANCLNVYRGGFTLGDAAAVLWLAGTGVLGTVVFLSNLRFTHWLRKRWRKLEETDAPIPVYMTEGLPSPCLFGVFRPAVYVTPEAAENPDTLRHVLAHELTHYAHKDHIWSLLRCAALALHWYNPLAWLSAVLSKQDGELACDEGAVARLGEKERIPYGRTLVDMVAVRSLRPGDLLCCSTAMSGGKKSIQQRIARLVKKPETVKAAVFAAAAVLVLAAVFVFAGRGESGAEHSELELFFAQSEAAQAVFIGEPMISSTITPSEISDPDLLSQAQELLSHAMPVSRLEDGSWRTLSFSSDSRDVTGITQDELEKLFMTGGRPLNLFPSSDRDLEAADRYWLVPWDARCLLVRWDLEREEDDIQPLGCYASDVTAPLKELARSNSGVSTSGGLSHAGYEGALSPEEQNAYLSESLQDCDSICFQAEPDRAITDPALLEEAKTVLTSGLLVDDRQRAGADGDNERIEIRSKDGLRFARFLVTNYTIRGRLHELMQIQHEPGSSLPPEQILRAEQAFQELTIREDGATAASEISCFFTSSYNDPTQINLEEFLRYCPLAEVLEEDEVEEFRTVMAKDATWTGDYTNSSPKDFMVPVKRYPREKVSALLQEYADVTVEELEWPALLTYVEEYDAFYNFTSDFGPGAFHCIGGREEGNTVLLWSERLDNGDRSELTLVKKNGSWFIQSFHSAYPR